MRKRLQAYPLVSILEICRRSNEIRSFRPIQGALGVCSGSCRQTQCTTSSTLLPVRSSKPTSVSSKKRPSFALTKSETRGLDTSKISAAATWVSYSGCIHWAIAIAASCLSLWDLAMRASASCQRRLNIDPAALLVMPKFYALPIPQTNACRSTPFTLSWSLGSQLRQPWGQAQNRSSAATTQ